MIHHADSHDQLAKTTSLGDPFFQIGDNIKAKDFPDNGRSIFELSSTTSINDAFHSLVSENLLSAPVYDSKANKYLGFLDVTDLLALAYGVELLMSTIPQTMVDGMDEASKKKKLDTSNILVSSLFDADGSTLSTSWCPVSLDAPLKYILLLLATKTRRVPVIDQTTGRVVKIISQSAVVAEFYHHMLASGTKTPASLLLTPRITGIGAKRVVTVGENEPAMKGFASIIENKISAVGVIDDDGHLLTCISTKDVRLLPVIEQAALTEGHKSVFDMPARLYAAAIRRITEKNGRTRASVVCAGLDTPLKLIIGKLAETHMHRIFIVDQNDKPVGVISVSDICSLLVEQQQWGNQ